MSLHMTKQEILNVLNRVGKVDLSIPESKKQEILRNPSLQKYLTSIEAAAAKHRGTPIVVLPYHNFKLFHETGDRTSFERDPVEGYFPRRGRLAAFGLMAWLYGREDDIHELEDILWAVCDEYTWPLPACLGPDRYTDTLEYGRNVVDLFSAETAQTLSEISAVLGDKLAPIVKKRIAYLVEERVFRQVINQTYGWMSGRSNWAAVCGGSVGMAAIHAIEDNEHLAAVLERILPALDTFLQSFAADGACMEGISYWSYGFSYFVSFADLLLRRTRGEMDLFKIPLVKKIAAFQQKCYFKGGRAVSFSDGESHAIYHPGLACYLSRKFQGVRVPPASAMGDFNRDICYRWSNLLRDLLWTEDCTAIPEVYDCYPLPAAQWYIGSGADDVGLAAKAGHNAEPHNHNDVGSFQIYKNGEELFADLGSGEYTRQYFSKEERYTFLVCGSQGHSVPIIDGCLQKPGREAAASHVAVDETGIVMDMAGAYGLDCLPSLEREVRFDRAAGVIAVTDTFTLTGDAHEVRERFVTRGDVHLEEGRALVRAGAETMELVFNPAVFTPEMATEVCNDHDAVPQRVVLLDLVARVQGSLTAEIIIRPVK